MTFDVKTLHEIERKLIKTLDNDKLGLDALTLQSALNIDQVRRGIEWLKYKNLVEISEKITKSLSLGDEGSNAVAKGLPERRLVNMLKSNTNISIQNAKEISGLDASEFNAGFANAMTKKWIGTRVLSGTTEIEISENIQQSPDEKLLSKLAGGEVPYENLSSEELLAYQFLRRRPDYIREKENKLIEVQLSQKGLALIEEVKKQPETERAIDVTAPAPIIFAGKKHPLQDIIDEVREVFIGLGFREIEGPLVQSSFWNFDALFTPNDHPARDMQDTFYVAKLQASNVADKKTINNVSRIHKRSWGYEWNINDARKLVLRTHTTPVTIRYLADNNPDEARVFSVGRVFRNEKLTYKHLAEFYQIEGIVVGKNVTLRDLMGLQTEFY
ncbi:MAG: phenylalanine--tRNA ligase subunit alpha, partial [Nitrososphaerales archaeon]